MRKADDLGLDMLRNIYTHSRRIIAYIYTYTYGRMRKADDLGLDMLRDIYTHSRPVIAYIHIYTHMAGCARQTT